MKQKLEPYCSAEHQLGGGMVFLSVGLGGGDNGKDPDFLQLVILIRIFRFSHNLTEGRNVYWKSASAFLSCPKAAFCDVIRV